MLRPLPNGDRPVFAWYELPDDTSICDLDDPARLSERTLRPSIIITRNYDITRAWALSIFQENAWAGVSWWSYCDARWTSIGLWRHDILTSYGVEELNLDHPAMQEAANVLSVDIDRSRRKRS